MCCNDLGSPSVLVSAHHRFQSSLSRYGRNQGFRCGGFYPKPMVTPVHRFQSISSPRCPSYQTRFPVINVQSPSSHNGSTGNVRNPQSARSIDLLGIAQTGTPTPQRSITPTAKLKCGVWIFFAIVTFLTGAKLYFHGIRMGMEALTFCTLLVLVLICGRVMTLCKTMASTANNNHGEISQTVHNPEPSENEEHNSNQVPNVGSQPMTEMPPPPYHIAIMLPQQNDDTIQVIRDSPPPSYEKAVT